LKPSDLQHCLTKLLLGSVESRVRADRSPAFGALAGLPKGKVEGLIDRLVEDGYLHRDLNHEYKIVTLTEQGAAATADDLEAYEARPRRTAVRGSDPGRGADTALGESADTDELDADDHALFERLRAWRRERATQDGLSPAYVAHNETLRELAVRRPSTPAMLARIGGLGPKKVEKYGDEILAIVAEA
jgi:ATP-dependent DNA helicase RecQ